MEQKQKTDKEQRTGLWGTIIRDVAFILVGILSSAIASSLGFPLITYLIILFLLVIVIIGPPIWQYFSIKKPDQIPDPGPGEDPGNNPPDRGINGVELLAPSQEFVGRVKDLEWLSNQLTTSLNGGIIEIYGMGGIGKTDLVATALAQSKIKSLYSDGIAVVVCQDNQPETEILQRILKRLLPGKQLSNENDIVGIARKLLIGKRILVVLDNVGPELNINEIIDPLRGVAATILFTSRERHSDIVPIESSYHLGLLTSEDAFEVLKRYSGGKISVKEEGKAKELIELVGRHTLALKLIGAYLQVSNAPIDIALTTQVKELKNNPVLAVLVANKAGEQIAELILKHSIDALPLGWRKFFTAMGAFGTIEFGNEALRSLSRLPDFIVYSMSGAQENTIQQFLDRCLIDQQAALPNKGNDKDFDNQRIRLHPLVFAYAKSLFEEWPTEMQDEVHVTIANFYIVYARKMNDNHDVQALGADQSNIAAVVEWAKSKERDVILAKLCDLMQQFWHDWGRTSEQLRYIDWGLEAAIRVAQQQESSDTEAWLPVARLGTTLGDMRLIDSRFTYLEDSELDKIEQLYQKSREIFEQQKQWADLGNTLGSLGQLAERRGGADEVITGYFDLGLAAYDKSKDGQGKSFLLLVYGRYEEYQKLTLQTFQTLKQAENHFILSREAAGSEASHRRSEAIRHLGEIAQIRGDWDKAAENYQASLTIKQNQALPDEEGAIYLLFCLYIVETQKDSASSSLSYPKYMEQVQGAGLNTQRFLFDFGELLCKLKQESGKQFINQAFKILYSLQTLSDQPHVDEALKSARERVHKLGLDISEFES